MSRLAVLNPERRGISMAHLLQRNRPEPANAYLPPNLYGVYDRRIAMRPRGPAVEGGGVYIYSITVLFIGYPGQVLGAILTFSAVRCRRNANA